MEPDASGNRTAGTGSAVPARHLRDRLRPGDPWPDRARTAIAWAMMAVAAGCGRRGYAVTVSPQIAESATDKPTPARRHGHRDAAAAPPGEGAAAVLVLPSW
jgi:hypothetical protein